MRRRQFINTSVLSGLGFAFGSWDQKGLYFTENEIRGAFSLNSNRITIHTKSEVKETRIFHITDTHLSLDDERGVPFREFSGRMAGAYAENAHFQTGDNITTKESFVKTLSIAKDEGADLIALTGDIFSFPSEAAVEWAHSMLMETEIPFVYIAGNHDWHYEGMKGS